MFLNEFDYAYITQQIQLIANKFCKGRVISVLEGGYNIENGLISSFAQSTFTHVKYLNITLNMFYNYDEKSLKEKKEKDIDNEEDNEHEEK